MTTSCCPAFVMMAKKHFPTVYEKNVSKMVSPMEAMARYLKSNDEKLKVVFIGPCVAKKMEAMEDFSVVDYVLTFEELAAMLVTRPVISILSRLKLMNVIVPAIMAGNFAIGGGVSKAVLQAKEECGDEAEITSVYADGSHECKKNLLLMKVNRFSADILEGMCCVGGCINDRQRWNRQILPRDV